MTKCDLLIIGSGIAGLSLAIKVSRQFPEKRIVIVTKGDEWECNTRFAQGGISAVCDFNNDSYERHMDDTLNAGDGLCERAVVEKVIREGYSALTELVNNGVAFDRDHMGELALNKEGGHSTPRIAHVKDMTGFEIMVALIDKVKTLPGITMLTYHTAIDLIVEAETPLQNESPVCRGAFILDTMKACVHTFLADVTVLATGGIGQLYKMTTNPEVATGDGIGIAHRAGASIGNMEFIQFHPTAFYSDDQQPQTFLITEALRGYGALLRNAQGNRFMFRYSSEGELACRDIVARAIENEIRISSEPCVYLDCTHLPAEGLKKNFPTVVSFCRERGIDVTRDLIPVAPAAHFLCGGINVNTTARTSLPGLYALGECANTGLHGANRLASNSLLEALAFAEFCFQDIKQFFFLNGDIHQSQTFKFSGRIECNDSIGVSMLKGKVKRIMTKHVGIVRNTEDLQYALGYLSRVNKQLNRFCLHSISTGCLELRNMLITAELIVMQSLNRTENRGTFYNTDLDHDSVLRLMNRKFVF